MWCQKMKDTKPDKCVNAIVTATKAKFQGYTYFFYIIVGAETSFEKLLHSLISTNYTFQTTRSHYV